MKKKIILLLFLVSISALFSACAGVETETQTQTVTQNVTESFCSQRSDGTLSLTNISSEALVQSVNSDVVVVLLEVDPPFSAKMTLQKGLDCRPGDYVKVAYSASIDGGGWYYKK